MKAKLRVLGPWVALLAPAIAYWARYGSDGWAGFAVGAFLVTMPMVERLARSG